jgi:hypothetical protein
VDHERPRLIRTSLGRQEKTGLNHRMTNTAVNYSLYTAADHCCRARRRRARRPPGARSDLAPPLTQDNFEGLAAVPRPEGTRFYLLADDNALATQRTLLLAFDWQSVNPSAKYTEDENVGHDQTKAMTDPELWKWLFGQRRSAPK